MPRGSSTKPEKIESEKKICASCEKPKNPSIDYYFSNSKRYADQRHPVCKKCILQDVVIEDLNTVKKVLLELNRPFLSNLWTNTLIEAEKKNSHPFGIYLKSVQLSFKDLTWTDSDADLGEKENVSLDNKKEIQQTQVTSVVKTEFTIDDRRNEEDVLRMLRYDPFEFETIADRRHLFNKLVDFLDEGTLEDSFKLPAVIEIVKTFNQIDKINSAISHIISDARSVASNAGGITSLVSSKEKMLKTVLALAKDNGISVNYNNNKSKGAGTLSGIIKQLHEKGIRSSEINIYDIETCEGMRQVADISNRSIMEQLMLNENDYVDMLKDQRDMILSLTEKSDKLEEENRLLKVKLKFSEIEERKTATYIEGETL